MSIYSLLRDGEQFTETTSSSDYNSRIDTYSKATLVEIHSIVRSLENDLSLCLRDDYKQQSILNVKHYSDIGRFIEQSRSFTDYIQFTPLQLIFITILTRSH